MELREAALKLTTELAKQPWFVAVGTRGAGATTLLLPTEPTGLLVVYVTNLRKAEKIVPMTCESYRVVIERTGRSKPASAPAN